MGATALEVLDAFNARLDLLPLDDFDELDDFDALTVLDELDAAFDALTVLGELWAACVRPLVGALWTRDARTGVAAKTARETNVRMDRKERTQKPPLFKYREHENRTNAQQNFRKIVTERAEKPQAKNRQYIEVSSAGKRRLFRLRPALFVTYSNVPPK